MAQETGDPAGQEAPTTVRRLDTPESGELAQLSAVFEDLQYVLRCCEVLVDVLSGVRPDPVMVESLWTGAVVGYVRCFSGRTKILTDADVDGLELEDEVKGFHKNFATLRDHYASRHVNPREAFTIGIAQSNDGKPTGVAIVSTPRPPVDDTTVRVLGRIAYSLSGVVDGRMQQAQATVLDKARQMTPAQLAELPLVHLSEEPVS
ncbi:hypothetical protein GCM10009836_30630 [Pseudonocardia ailaonensis]|uniref:GAF domain-containing protein n=1 Tax=Pseudonocardia ailaonensis TaxID=367279 RepID=A0ABN2N214_9PSEU